MDKNFIKKFGKNLEKRLSPFIEEENGKKYIGGLRVEGIIISITQALRDTIIK